jgi:sugar phosphate isomerase/epimerase
VLGPDDLVITGATLGNPPFGELVEAAAGAGFAGLSLWPRETYLRARAAGCSDAELRRMLGDAGLEVNDVDALIAWVDGARPERGELAGPSEAELFEAAHALGAPLLNVVLMKHGALEVQEAADAFAGICERASAAGLRAHLEFLPFYSIPDARTAWRIVEASGRPEAGLMVDTWHCFRGGTTPADLRALPGRAVLGVQLNDAPAQVPPDPRHETLHERLAPGEGDIDLVGLLRALDAIGARAPLTVEVFSDRLRAEHPPAQLAQRLAQATRRVVRQARGG